MRTEGLKGALPSALMIVALMFSAISLFSASPVSEEGLNPSAPIYIDGNAGFTSRTVPSGSLGRLTIFSAPTENMEKSESEYAAGELIVKVKQGREGNAASLNISQWVIDVQLRNLHEKWKVKDYERAFKSLESQMMRENVSEQTVIQIIMEKFPQRAARALGPLPKLNLSGIFLLKLPENVDIFAAAIEYEQNPYVEYAQPNYIYQIALTPDDPYYSSSGTWGQSYDDMWGLKIIQAENAWNEFENENAIGENVVVAVVDTGADYNHIDLAVNIWTNPAEVAGNGMDDDNNGYIDDVRGWDFINDDNDPMDGHGHGTHVSGTIAAVTNNGIGVASISWQSNIMPVKGLDDYGYGTSTQLANALEYAVANGADVINNSWGDNSRHPSDPLLEDGVNLAHAAGVVIVFAAGNNNDNVMFYSPANSENVITVSSFDHNDQKTSFSNWGERIDVAAPGGDSPIDDGDNLWGRNILSLRSAGTDMYGGGIHIVGENYYRARGTSMAAPHVSGVAALLLSLRPELSNEAVRQILRLSADDVDAPGWDINSGYGRINAFDAIMVAYGTRWSSQADWEAGTYENAYVHNGSVSVGLYPPAPYFNGVGWDDEVHIYEEVDILEAMCKEGKAYFFAQDDSGLGGEFGSAYAYLENTFYLDSAGVENETLEFWWEAWSDDFNQGSGFTYLIIRIKKPDNSWVDLWSKTYYAPWGGTEGGRATVNVPSNILEGSGLYTIRIHVYWYFDVTGWFDTERFRWRVDNLSFGLTKAKHTTQWRDVGAKSAWQILGAISDIGAGEIIIARVEVSNDGENVDDYSEPKDLVNGISTYDISGLQDARYVRMVTYLMTSSLDHAPKLNEYVVTSEAIPVWQLTETWTGTIQAPAAWQIIETWTGTIQAPAEWQLIETWDGIVEAPVGWQLVEIRTGTIEAPPPWVGTAAISLVNLYTVNVEKILDLNRGSKLVVKFYGYSDAYENENVIESFVPPAHVEENENARHPEGIGVKKVKLNLTTDNTENVIATIATFTVGRNVLNGLLVDIYLEWPFADADLKNDLFAEISAIYLQWPFAPP